MVYGGPKVEVQRSVVKLARIHNWPVLQKQELFVDPGASLDCFVLIFLK